MFLAHTTDVAVNFKKPLIQFQKKKSLFNSNGIYKLTNNICPHQGSLISSDYTNKFKCQYHGWSWNDAGEPVSAGSTNLCNRSNITMSDTHVINSLVFSSAIDLSSVSIVDLSYMELTEERVDLVTADFKNIIDVFLDVDHIPVVHSGIYDTIGISGAADVKWKYYDWGNIQLVDKNIHVSDEFQSTLLGIEEEKIGAFWVTVFPYTMIEWQPGAMFVTTCRPYNDQTKVSVLKYKDSRYNDINWTINSELWETAWQQDKTQSEAIVARSSYAEHLEASKIQFRQWTSEHGLT